jgi:drug/metabolite transporter (DMT)-like permease
MLEGKILVGVAIALVAAVLIVGLYSLYRGGDFARSYSNKIMRLRVVMQFIAIIIIMAVLYFWGRGPEAP